MDVKPWSLTSARWAVAGQKGTLSFESIPMFTSVHPLNLWSCYQRVDLQSPVWTTNLEFLQKWVVGNKKNPQFGNPQPLSWEFNIQMAHVAGLYMQQGISETCWLMHYSFCLWRQQAQMASLMFFERPGWKVSEIKTSVRDPSYR